MKKELSRLEENKNNFKQYDIWIEGSFNETAYLGSEEGKTFEDACKKFVNNNKAMISYYNDKNNTYCGCRLFDNEADARKSYNHKI